MIPNTQPDIQGPQFPLGRRDTPDICRHSRGLELKQKVARILYSDLLFMMTNLVHIYVFTATVTMVCSRNVRYVTTQWKGLKNKCFVSIANEQTLEDSPKIVDRRYLALSSFEISQIKTLLVEWFLDQVPKPTLAIFRTSRVSGIWTMSGIWTVFTVHIPDIKFWCPEYGQKNRPYSGHQ